MEFLELKADKRESIGNGPARVLRREGKIPAVLYGPGKDSVNLSVSKNELEHVIKGRSITHVIVDLLIRDDKKSKRHAMIKELQTNPVTHDFLHVDFYEISMDRKIRVDVPVKAVGKSIGVEMGGILQIVRRELEVLCLPGEIPESFEIDITDLDIGDSFHVKDIPLTGNVEIPTEVNFTVLTIVSPKVEEMAAAEGEEAEGEAAEEGAEAEESEATEGDDS